MNTSASQGWKSWLTEANRSFEKAASNLRVLQVYRTYFPDGASGMAESIRQICAGSKDAGVDKSVFA